MKEYFKLLRVKHYLKNLLIFVPLIFSKNILRWEYLINTILGFMIFSMAASAIYIINDINDIENDRKHPEKCKRPLASGEIPISTAYKIFSILIVAIIGLNYYIASDKIWAWISIFVYVISNVAYSKGLKNIALIDIGILVIGYIIRIYYGAILINTDVSNWLYLTVTFMAFFLALGKRRNEIQNQGSTSRKVLKQYNEKFLDKNMYMCLATTIVFYSLWCGDMVVELGKSFILATVPFVVLICMKYSLIVEGESDGDPIEVVFKDKIMMVLITIYSFLMGVIVYG